MPGLIAFLLKAIGISLSGVMAPGPVTTATIAAGTRNRHAGGLIAIGHGIVEFPLILLIMAGMDWVFANEKVGIAIGVLGGAFLIHMGVGILRTDRTGNESTGRYSEIHPVRIGIVLTAGNPYFLLWWVFVGLTLAREAWSLGVFAFGLFALVHWLCDLVWLELLSQAAHRGSRIFGDKAMRWVLIACGVALILFGGHFLFDAGRRLLAEV